MDSDLFHDAMQMLASLPSAQGVDPTNRYETYAEAFAAEDPEIFFAACKVGFNTVWRFFPTPVEIHEQMERVRQGLERAVERKVNEARVARSIEHAAAEAERRDCQNANCALCRRDRRIVSTRLQVLPDARPAAAGAERAALADAHQLLERVRRLATSDRPRGGTPQRIGSVIDLAARRRQPTSDGGMP